MKKEEIKGTEDKSEESGLIKDFGLSVRENQCYFYPSEKGMLVQSRKDNQKYQE